MILKWDAYDMNDKNIRSLSRPRLCHYPGQCYANAEAKKEIKIGYLR